MFIKDIIEEKKLLKKTAVIYKDIHYSYGDLYEDSSTIGKKISETEGNIAIFLPNSYEYVVAFFSIAFAGKLAVPISVNTRESELLKTIQYCDVSLVITNSIYYEMLIEKNIGCVDTYLMDRRVIIKDSVSGKRYLFPGYSDEKSPFLLIHTSGSLSYPKRVMLSHDNLISNAQSIVKSLQLSFNDISMIVLPLFLISAITSQMIANLLIGATLVILELPFMVNDFWHECKKNSVTNITCVPTILNLLTLRNSTYNEVFALKKICFGGAPTSKQRIAELIVQFPSVDFVHMYGQTEASARLTHLLPEDFADNIGSVGKPIPGVELKIVNNSGMICKPMIIGEVCARGRNIMLGYYKKIELTKQVLIDGWLYTGDLGYFDSNGFLYIVGRRKNIIISGGFNIYPEEIEEVLVSNENIVDAIVYGMQDALLGEVVCAKIVTKKVMDEEEVIEYCMNLLSSYKVPQKIVFCKKIDKTPTGKIRRSHDG